jgi:hypothetical protein
MGDRWYDPAIGLWIQPDTIVPNPLDPLSLNRYAFVEGNPLRYRDPSGHAVETGCQDPTGCPSGNPPPGMTGTPANSAQLPPNGQRPCDLLPLACKPVGNYAVWIYLCDAGSCDWYYLPIAGAVAPPDASTDAQGPSDDLGDGTIDAGIARATTGKDSGASRGGFGIKFRGPAAKGFDWEHILERHSDAGDVAQQRAAQGKGTTFEGLTVDQIKARVQAAWRNRELVQPQIDHAGATRMRYRGVDPVSGQTVEMWYNQDTGIVETAYPILPGAGP